MQRSFHNTPLVCALFVLVLFLWQVPFYTQDGPNHKKIAVILSRLSRSPAEAAVYADNLGLWHTNSLFPLLYQPLAPYLSPDLYEKCFVGFFLVLLLCAFRCFLTAWAPDNRALWVLFLPFCFHPIFMRGMYNYLASIPLTLTAFSLLRLAWHTGRRSLWPLFALCCWVAWLAHPFPFFALGLGFAVMVLVEGRQGVRTALPYGAVICLFLVGGFLLPLWQAPHAMQAPYVFASLPVLFGGFFLLNFMDYSLVSLLVMLPFFGMLVWLLYQSVKAGKWPEKAFWMAFLIGYLLFPSRGSVGAQLSDRFLPFIWLFLPLGLPPLEARAVRKIAVVSFLTFLLAASSVFWAMQTIAAEVQDAQHVLQALPAQARLYPINFDLKGPGVIYRNLNHIWAVYDDDKVVFSPYLAAFPRLTPLIRKVPNSATYFPATAEGLPEETLGNAFCRPDNLAETPDCQAIRAEIWQKILQKSAYYDYWFVRNAPPEFSALLAALPGLQQMAASGRCSLWHYAKAKRFDPVPAP